MKRKLKVNSILLFLSIYTILYTSPSYSLNVKSAKEMRPFIDKIVEEIFAARLAEHDFIYFLDEEAAVNYGIDYQNDAAVIRFLEITRYRMEKKAKESIRAGNLPLALILGRQARLIRLAILSAIPRPPTAFKLPILAIPALIFVSSCVDCEKIENPHELIAKDQIGEYDLATYWQLGSTEYLWFPRSKRLFVIQDGIRQYPTEEEVRLFNKAKASSSNPIIRKWGARLANEQIPQFQSLSDGTKWARNNYFRTETVPQLMKIANAHYALAAHFLKDWHLFKAWKEIKTGFLYADAFREVNRQRNLNHLSIIKGARLSRTKIEVLDVGTGNGHFMPYIKEFLEARGFEFVDVIGIDNGDWMKDAELPNPDHEMKKEIVEMSERVLKQQYGQSYSIFFYDIFASFPPEWIHGFDIIFLNAVPLNLTTSFVHAALSLVKDDGLIILRFSAENHDFMNVRVLKEFCETHGLSLRTILAGTLPEGSAKLKDIVFVIKRTEFTAEAKPMTAVELIEREFLGARMAKAAS